MATATGLIRVGLPFHFRALDGHGDRLDSRGQAQENMGPTAKQQGDVTDKCTAPLGTKSQAAQSTVGGPEAGTVESGHTNLRSGR
mmetsp:Transcript_125842/g.288210  ORF Transcript_125842/g.288210 Transcript_125842/m.288210 type:complete len:85 (+) Transcript_125842:8-262(+)